MQSRGDEFLGWLFFIGVIAALFWEFQPVGRLSDTPTMYYKRISCIYSDPCETIWGSASFRLNAEAQSVTVRHFERDFVTIFNIPGCSIWDRNEWTCDHYAFGGFFGRRDGNWYSGDRTLQPMDWRFAWLMESKNPEANQIPAEQ